MKIIGLYASTLVLYALLDLGFIGLFASDFIRRQVGPKLAPAPDWAAAGVFYFLFAAALLYFCVLPAQSGARALFNGAFFGLVAYGTYELVNRALLAD